MHIECLVQLGGHEAVPATLQIHQRPPGTRALRSGGFLLLFLLLALVGAIIPPHIPWALGALGAGLYLGHREWHAKMRVESFEGRCPRCGSALKLGAGQDIQLPLTLTCFHCHHEPKVVAS